MPTHLTKFELRRNPGLFFHTRGDLVRSRPFLVAFVPEVHSNRESDDRKAKESGNAQDPCRTQFFGTPGIVTAVRAS